MSTELLPGFEPAAILLSIRPVFARLIANGSKTVELRRRFPEVPPGSQLVVYTTQPVAAVSGLARLRRTTSTTLPALWRRFGAASAVSKATFDLYFDECAHGLALELEDFTPLTPALGLVELRRMWPGFVPPQSYRYVPDHILSKIRARTTSTTKRSAAALSQRSRR